MAPIRDVEVESVLRELGGDSERALLLGDALEQLVPGEWHPREAAL